MARFPHGLMFHRFHEEGTRCDGQGSLSPSEFEKIILSVGIENICPPGEWLKKLANHALKDSDICLTFDDGLKCQYDICLPILEKHGLKAFWFVYSSVFDGKFVDAEIYHRFGTTHFSGVDQFQELFFSQCPKSVLSQLDRSLFKKYATQMKGTFPFYSANDLKFRFIRNELLSKEEFKNMMDQMMKKKGASKKDIARDLWLTDSDLKMLNRSGHNIGLHSYDHPFELAKLSYDEQLDQYSKNYVHLQKICGEKVLAMSHPLNSYNNDTLKILKHLGLQCGFRSNVRPPDGKKVNPGPLEMAREDGVNILKRMSL